MKCISVVLPTYACLNDLMERKKRIDVFLTFSVLRRTCTGKNCLFLETLDRSTKRNLQRKLKPNIT